MILFATSLLLLHHFINSDVRGSLASFAIKNWRRERPGNEAKVHGSIYSLASFPGLQSTANAVEGLVKLLRRMTSGGREGGRRTFGGVVLSV